MSKQLTSEQRYEIYLGIKRHWSKSRIAREIGMSPSTVCREVRRNKDVVTHFEELLDGYFVSDNPGRIGTPTVAWCAGQLHLSPNYFGDLIKKETGRSAIENIQLKMMNAAKDLLVQTNKTVSEIAYGLGYQYPQYFSRAFKKSVGCSPQEYRMSR